MPETDIVILIINHKNNMGTDQLGPVFGIIGIGVDDVKGKATILNERPPAIGTIFVRDPFVRKG